MLSSGLLQADQQVTFNTVADLACVGRATLYRGADLRVVADEHRTRPHSVHPQPLDPPGR